MGFLELDSLVTVCIIAWVNIKISLCSVMSTINCTALFTMYTIIQKFGVSKIFFYSQETNTCIQQGCIEIRSDSMGPILTI